MCSLQDSTGQGALRASPWRGQTLVLIGLDAQSAIFPLPTACGLRAPVGLGVSPLASPLGKPLFARALVRLAGLRRSATSLPRASALGCPRKRGQSDTSPASNLLRKSSLARI